MILDQNKVTTAAAAMMVAADLPIAAMDEKTYRDQVVAFILALNKNYEREQSYKGLWQKETVEELGGLVSHKGKRMAAHDVVMSDEPLNISVYDNATDDALDIINYGAFAARRVHYAAVENGLGLTQS